MTTRWPIPLLLALSTGASAADRTVGVGSFEKVRIEGPFEVRIATGTSPAARITGDRAAIEAIDLGVQGTTLTLRAGTGGWGERPAAAANGAPIVVTLATPMLTAATVIGGGRLTIGRMKAARIDLAISGPGSIAIATAEADQLNATLAGAGTLAIAGRVARVRLIASGAATIDAAALDAGDLIVLAAGEGQTTARARYTAQVTNTGLGSVTIAGPAKCTIRATAGPVACGR